jgi:hypothetical protein
MGFCSGCGFKLTELGICRNCGKPTSSTDSLSKKRNTTKPEAYVIAVVGILLIVVFSIAHINSSPSTPETVQPLERSKPEPTHIEPELQMSELMLQPRSRIEAKLGRPVSPAVECADTQGKQYEYADGSYLCADGGLVVLFSYVLRQPVSNADAALQAVGLHADAPAFTILDVVHIWSHQHNNPIMVGKRYANQITVMIGVPPKRVEVAMK